LNEINTRSIKYKGKNSELESETLDVKSVLLDPPPVTTVTTVTTVTCSNMIKIIPNSISTNLSTNNKEYKYTYTSGDILNGIYSLSCSSFYNDNWKVEKAFNGLTGHNNHWFCANGSYNSDGSQKNNTATVVNGTTIYGEWIQIQLPFNITKFYISFGSREDWNKPYCYYLLTSIDGSTWKNVTGSNDGTLGGTCYNGSSNNNQFNYLRMVIKSTGFFYCSVGNIKLYGAPVINGSCPAASSDSLTCSNTQPCTPYQPPPPPPPPAASNNKKVKIKKVKDFNNKVLILVSKNFKVKIKYSSDSTATVGEITTPNTIEHYNWTSTSGKKYNWTTMPQTIEGVWVATVLNYDTDYNTYYFDTLYADNLYLRLEYDSTYNDSGWFKFDTVPYIYEEYTLTKK
jgi:hypothetical protein